MEEIKMSAVIFANENIVVREAGKEELEKLSASAEFAGLVGEDCTVCSVSATNGELYGAIARRRYTQWQMEGIICFTLPEHRRSGTLCLLLRFLRQQE